MGAEKGLSMTIGVGDGASAEVFTIIGGMRTTGLTLNGELVDITDKDSAGWRELQADAGVKSVTVTGSGVFKDTASEETARVNAFNQSLDNYELTFEDGDTITAAFQISSLEYNGDHNNARQYSMTLESSGTVVYA